MAKNAISAQEMARKLMSPAAVTAIATADATTSAATAPVVHELKAKPQEVKRLNLDITIPQWRKLKNVAMNRGVTVSDLVREWIDRL